MIKWLFLISVFLVPNVTNAWEILTEKEGDGRVFEVAEQIGDAGTFLRLVCFERKTHIEIVYPAGIDAQEDFVEVLQVDNRPERLVAGFIEEIDRSTSVFIGVDRRDEPAASTPDLLKEIAAGTNLYLGDPDRAEAIGRWSLAGSRKAMQMIKQRCS